MNEKQLVKLQGPKHVDVTEWAETIASFARDGRVFDLTNLSGNELSTLETIMGASGFRLCKVSEDRWVSLDKEKMQPS